MGMNWHKLHTRTILSLYFHFRDDNNEYQDHIDISKCIPSIKISSLSLMDPPKEQATLDFSKFPAKGAIG